MGTKHFQVTLRRSSAGRSESVKGTLNGLGLKRRGRTVSLNDTPAIRGMLYKVVHMVDVKAVDGPVPAAERGHRHTVQG